MAQLEIPEPKLDITDPNYFYNNGDDPALKNYLELLKQNFDAGHEIDAKIPVIYEGQRSIIHRDWEDVFFRGLSCYTWPRQVLLEGFCIYSFFIASNQTLRLLPIDRMPVAEMPFIRQFGRPGAFAALLGMAFYFNFLYESQKFFVKWTYKRWVMGQKNWDAIRQKENMKNFREFYYFSDSHFHHAEGHHGVNSWFQKMWKKKEKDKKN